MTCTLNVECKRITMPLSRKRFRQVLLEKRFVLRLYSFYKLYSKSCYEAELILVGSLLMLIRGHHHFIV